MSNVIYNLRRHGKKLTELLKEGDPADVIEHIEISLNYITEIITEEDEEEFKQDIQDLKKYLDGEAELIRENPDEIIKWGGFKSYKEAMETIVRDRLEQFYELCEYLGVWL